MKIVDQQITLNKNKVSQKNRNFFYFIHRKSTIASFTFLTKRKINFACVVTSEKGVMDLNLTN